MSSTKINYKIILIFLIIPIILGYALLYVLWSLCTLCQLCRLCTLCQLCRLCTFPEDGDASEENWTDHKGEALDPDRFWSSGLESEIAGDDEGPCKGIELNFWERAKVIFSYS
jgi:hypothetical protein